MCLVWSLNTIKKSGSFFYIHFEITQMILHYRKEMEELRKENLFLKKAAAFFAKEID